MRINIVYNKNNPNRLMVVKNALFVLLAILSIGKALAIDQIGRVFS